MSKNIGLKDLPKDLQVIRPKGCPFELIRIGGNSDGAYLLPNDLDGIKACFSPGVNNFKNFEDELTSDYQIKSHMCDFSSDEGKLKTSLIDGMQTFKKKWLDVDGVKDSITLDDWINELEPNSDDLILQMDIEGAEYRNLLACSENTLKRFRIIVIELHELAAIRNSKHYNANLGPLLKKLDKLFVCVHTHPNNCCGDFFVTEYRANIPRVIEVTFLRKDRIKTTSNKSISPVLPHPLDVTNVSRNPPLFLNQYWLNDHTQSESTNAQMLKEEIEYWKNKPADPIQDYDKLFLNVQQMYKNAIESLVNAKPWGKDFGHIKEVANNKKYCLSGSYRGSPSEGVVTNKAPYFFHTQIDVDQYITIDLATEHHLHSMTIHNRTDCCWNRARSVFYILHSEKKPDFSNGWPIYVTKEFLAGKNMLCVTPLLDKMARYVTLFSPEKTAIHFKSIELYGTKI